jgi:zinc/manganese transport system substrate-binding protein
VAAIFPESSLNPKLERAVARETGVRVGGRLWADALGPPGSSGDTYLHSMAANARARVEGMSGGSRSCRLEA